MRTAPSFALALAALTATRVAGAQAPDEPLPKLVVTRSAEANDCPDAPTLAEAVGKLMGKLPALDTTSEGAQGAAGFDVEIAKAEDGYTAIVHPRAEATAERRISDPGRTCEGLAQALALTLAMLLDKDQPPPAPGARTAEGPGPGPPKPAPKPLPPAPVVPRGPRRNLGLAIDDGADNSVALLDELAWAFFGEVEYRISPAWSIAGGVLYLPTDAFEAGSVEARDPDNPPHIDFSVVAGTLRGCGFFLQGSPTGGRWPPRLGGCVLGAVGSLRSEGVGFSVSHPPSSLLWATVGAAAIAEQPIADFPILGPLAVTARLGLLAPVLRHTFRATVHNQDTDLFTMHPAGGFVELGVRMSIL